MQKARIERESKNEWMDKKERESVLDTKVPRVPDTEDGREKEKGVKGHEGHEEHEGPGGVGRGC